MATHTKQFNVIMRQQRLRKAQEFVRKYMQPNHSVVDELIRERRQAAAEE